MNENFLDKLFKIYSIISYNYATSKLISDYLISSYYMHDGLIFPYEYIDFELMYNINNNVPLTVKPTLKDLKVYINKLDIEHTDVAIFLYNIHNKIINNINRIIKEDLMLLNEYYKQTF